MISIIIPVGTEKNIEQYKKILDSTESQDVVTERIWVGGSEEIQNWLLSQKEHHISAPGLNRAARMNLGIQKAKYDCFLLNHPRSVLQKGALGELSRLIQSKNSDQAYWGCFTHKFMGEETLLKRFTSWYSNQIRCAANNVVYLDHCFYLSRQMYKQIGLLPEEDIFEDSLLSYKLRDQAPCKRLESISLTSDVRFKKQGFAKQAILNQFVKILFLAGVSPPKINEIYEKGLWLN